MGVIRAEQPQHVGEQRLESGGGAGGVPGPPPPAGKLAAGSQRFGVVSAKHPQPRPDVTLA